MKKIRNSENRTGHVLRVMLPVLGTLLAAILLLPFTAKAAEDPSSSARDISPLSVVSPAGNRTDALTDGNYGTAVAFEAEEAVTVSADTPISSLYIEWARIPGAWTLEAGGTSISCGENGFLHEYVELPAAATECTLRLPSGGRMANIRAFSEGTPPSGVQVWETPCGQADFLVFSTHADDEILFLGGVLATYGSPQNLDLQVAYMIDFTETDLPVREHEKLDGLWTIGIRHYPVNASILNDTYSTTLDAARNAYSYDVVCSFTTEAIRRFKPQVVVTQDFNGEYGHGAHMLLAHAVSDGVDNSADASYYPDSASAYGTWDVPKAYFHLYEENPIRLDLRQPLDSLGGKTAVEAATDAYKMHVSQQWMDFYVSDDSNDTNKYAPKCADFGLYRTLVGADTGNDMMEHLTSYTEQARLGEEERRREEARKKAEEKQAKAALQYTDKTGTGSAGQDRADTSGEGFSVLRIALITVAVLAAVLALLSGFALWQRKKRRRGRRRKKTPANRSATRPRRRGY